MRGYLLLAFLATAFLIYPFYADHAQETTITPSIDVLAVLDNSGSMEVSDPNFLAGKMILRLIDNLSPNSRVGIVVFAESPFLAMPLTPKSSLSKEVAGILDKVRHPNVNNVNNALKVIVQEGDTLWKLAERYYGDASLWRLIRDANNIPNTSARLPAGAIIRIPLKKADRVAEKSGKKELKNIPAAVERAIYELKQNGRIEAKKLIFLMTDGMVNSVSRSKETEKYRWLKEELVEESKKIEARIFGIAFTDQADYELIQTLALKTYGSYYRVFRDEDIQEVIKNINGIMLGTRPASQSETPTQTRTEEAGQARKILSLKLIPAVVIGLLIPVIPVALLMKKRRKSGAEQEVIVPESFLIDLDDNTDKKTHTINKTITRIGRLNSGNVDICINRNTVSAIHAQIIYKNRAFYIEDLASTNGTYLNDREEKITGEARLRSGDIVNFDQYKFKFVVRGQSERSQKHISPGKTHETPVNASRSKSPSTEMMEAEEKDQSIDTNMDMSETYLIDINGVTDKSRHKIDKKVIKIGRIKENDVCINKNTVSALHAQIEYKDAGFYLTDLGSTNGTYLSEGRQRITSEVRLGGDDTIYFDQYEFRLLVHRESNRTNESE